MNCVDPKIIQHPLVGEFYSKSSHLVMAGRTLKLNHRSEYFSKYIKILSVKSTAVSRDTMDYFYFLDDVTGVVYPVYLLVKCGRCSVCRQSKSASLVERCRLECQSYNSMPIFLTLTYDDDHLSSSGLCVRDVQLFFKRLRINLHRDGYTDKIRYLVVGEYGKRTFRPHYHALIWNLHCDAVHDLDYLKNVINRSWRQGFTLFRFVDPSDDKCFRYTSKYLYKQHQPHPDGCAPNFLCSSNRGGGIGALFVDTLSDDVRKSLNLHPKFYDRFTNRVQDLHMSSYVFNRLFPSLNQSLTSSFRSQIKNFLLAYNFYYINGGVTMDMYDARLLVFQKLRKYMYLPDLFPSLPPSLIDADLAQSYLNSFFASTLHRLEFFDSGNIDKLAVMRDKMVLKISRASIEDESILPSRAERFERMTDYLEQFEIF